MVVRVIGLPINSKGTVDKLAESIRSPGPHFSSPIHFYHRDQIAGQAILDGEVDEFSVVELIHAAQGSHPKSSRSVLTNRGDDVVRQTLLRRVTVKLSCRKPR